MLLSEEALLGIFENYPLVNLVYIFGVSTLKNPQKMLKLMLK